MPQPIYIKKNMQRDAPGPEDAVQAYLQGALGMSLHQAKNLQAMAHLAGRQQRDALHWDAMQEARNFRQAQEARRMRACALRMRRQTPPDQMPGTPPDQSVQAPEDVCASFPPRDTFRELLQQYGLAGTQAGAGPLNSTD